MSLLNSRIKVREAMSFNKYDSVEGLNDSKEEWILRLRAQSIWKGITRQTGEFRGYNIIFFDDSVSVTQTLIYIILPQFLSYE